MRISTIFKGRIVLEIISLETLVRIPWLLCQSCQIPVEIHTDLHVHFNIQNSQVQLNQLDVHVHVYVYKKTFSIQKYYLITYIKAYS